MLDGFAPANDPSALSMRSRPAASPSVILPVGASTAFSSTALVRASSMPVPPQSTQGLPLLVLSRMMPSPLQVGQCLAGVGPEPLGATPASLVASPSSADLPSQSGHTLPNALPVSRHVSHLNDSALVASSALLPSQSGHTLPNALPVSRQVSHLNDSALVASSPQSGQSR